MLSFLKKKKYKKEAPVFEKNLKGKIIFIRHGETNYNIDAITKGVEIKGDMKYIDGHLNASGEIQAIKSSKKFKSLNIEDVYVSPLFRALQTSTLIFNNHPNKKNIIMHVHPLLTEVVSSVNNFTWNIEDTKKIFNMNSEIKVDWTFFDNEFKTPKEQNFFYLNYVDLLSAQKYQEIKKKLYDSYGTDKVKSNVGELGKLIVELKMNRIESLDHIFERAVSFKKFLKEKFKNTMNDASKKIVIISHLCFGQMFTSRECYIKKPIENYPADSCELDNCEGISVFI